MAKKKKNQQDRKRSWCWYCDREFDDDKILFQHQRMKHFQCNICHRKLNSASGLVIHMAQVHKENMEKVPNAVDGHDSPELEIYCMDGVPEEDLQRHYDGLPIVPYTKSKLIIGDASILPILAAQKASVAAQLAESKNMTVIGDLASPTGSNGSSGTGSGPIISPSLGGGSSSSATSVVSPPVPAAVVSAPAVNTQAADYWNNPYVMAAYYQQQQQQQQQHSVQQNGHYPQYPQYPQCPQYPQSQGAQYPQYPQSQGAQYSQQQQQQQAYAQYYQAYAQYYSQQQSNVPSPVIAPPLVETSRAAIEDKVVIEDNGPLVIPSYVDPNTKKTIPGTIFTVLSLDRSMEELRSELKRYQKRNE